MKVIKVNLINESLCDVAIEHIVAYHQNWDADDKEKGCVIKLSGGHTIITTQNYKTIQNWIDQHRE